MVRIHFSRTIGSRSTALIAILPLSLATADVEIECVPYDTDDVVARWERGTTRRMDLFVINNSSSVIIGADWRTTAPPSLSGFLTDVTSRSDRRPIPCEDFFAGASMFFAVYSPLNMASGALVNDNSDGAPPGMSGALQRYDILVSTDAPLGVFDFLLVGMGFGEPPHGNLVPHVILEDRSFRIMPKKSDVNGDGVVAADDITALTDALLGSPTLQQGETYAGEYCDWSGNDDGQLDGSDVQQFVANYFANG